MRRFSVLARGMALVLALSMPAGAIIRLNGNQLVESGVTYGSDVRARAAAGSSPQAAAPARLIATLGQGVMARGELPDSAVSGENVAILIGMGLGYDIANVVYQVFCPIGYTGDINNNGDLSAEDIIMLVNYVFKSGEGPRPCPPAGDVNCSSQVTASDVTYLVTFVFLSGDAPCDVCDLPVEKRPCQISGP
jgi:hypothetical protein